MSGHARFSIVSVEEQYPKAQYGSRVESRMVKFSLTCRRPSVHDGAYSLFQVHSTPKLPTLGRTTMLIFRCWHSYYCPIVCLPASACISMTDLTFNLPIVLTRGLHDIVVISYLVPARPKLRVAGYLRSMRANLHHQTVS